MRHTILMLAGLLSLAAWPSDLVAQGRRPDGRPAPTDSIIDSYIERLKLTNEQEANMREILETQAEKGRKMFDAASAQGREAMGEVRPKMAELQADTDQQVEALLTEDQIPEYRKIQAEIQERRRSMRQRQPGG